MGTMTKFVEASISLSLAKIESLGRFANGPKMLEYLGLPDGWWCGLELSRAKIFGEEVSGDVDLIAGPMVYDFDQGEWIDRISAAVETHGDRNAIAMAHMRAGQEGRVVWPPPIESVVACEAKASYLKNGVLKRTHVAERHEILGQLKYLREHGVNRLGFVHLVSTVPIGESGDAWLSAETQLQFVEGELREVLRLDDLPGVGLFRGYMGAVPGGTEDVAGVHWGMIQAAPELLCPATPLSWHDDLGARLARLPRPSELRTYIFECPDCGEWTHAPILPLLGFHCRCGRAL